MNDDHQMLRQYAEEGSEKAFGLLVERFLDLVYCTALRKVGGNAPLAQEVTQIVFSDLARKARTISAEVVLGGWLYRHACQVAAQTVRTERRRQVREQEAMAMNTLHPEPEFAWEHLAPHLDEAMQRLGSRDRDALVLRYFERRDLRGVSHILGTSEEGARKRVSRAVEKLRAYFHQRGLTLSAATLASLLAGHAVTAAPAGLAASITGAALASAAAAGTGIAQLLMEVMATSKVKAGLVGALYVAGLAAPPGLHYQSEAQAQFTRFENGLTSPFKTPPSTMNKLTHFSMATALGAALTTGQAGPKGHDDFSLEPGTVLNEATDPLFTSSQGSLNHSSQTGLMAEAAFLAPSRPKPAKTSSQAGQLSAASSANQPTGSDHKAISGLADGIEEATALGSSASATDQASASPTSSQNDNKAVVMPSGSNLVLGPTNHVNLTVSNPSVFTLVYAYDQTNFQNGIIFCAGITNGGNVIVNFTNIVLSGGGVFAPIPSISLHIIHKKGEAPKGDTIILSWNGGPGIVLQKTSTLTKPKWQNVPNTEGKSSATLPISEGNALFRLVGDFTIVFTPGIIFQQP